MMPTEGPECCSTPHCGKAALFGHDHCHCCEHGMLPEPQPDCSCWLCLLPRTAEQIAESNRAALARANERRRHFDNLIARTRAKHKHELIEAERPEVA